MLLHVIVTCSKSPKQPPVIHHKHICYRETKPAPGCTEDDHPLVMLSFPVSIESLDVCPINNSSDINTLLSEGDFPPELEDSDVSFSVHQQNGEGKAEEIEGRGNKQEGGHESSVQGDPKMMRQVSMFPTDESVHNNYIENGNFLVLRYENHHSYIHSRTHRHTHLPLPLKKLPSPTHLPLPLKNPRLLL